jgi:hypothetical protein
VVGYSISSRLTSLGQARNTALRCPESSGFHGRKVDDLIPDYQCELLFVLSEHWSVQRRQQYLQLVRSRLDTSQYEQITKEWLLLLFAPFC